MQPLDFAKVLQGDDPEPDYIVQDCIHTGQMIVLAGDPGVGKSFLCYALAMSIAAGRNSFLGMIIKHGRVLYFDEENSKVDLNQYLRWIWRGLDSPDIAQLQANLFVEHFSITKQPQRYSYMAQVAAEVKPLLIVVDTVGPVCNIISEDSNDEAKTAIANLRAVQAAALPETTMILLKHAKFTHDTTLRQTIRGAKQWINATDGTIFHKLASGKPRQDGLRNSRLVPDKVRAFGLREEIIINPQRVGLGKQVGIRLHRG